MNATPTMQELSNLSAELAEGLGEGFSVLAPEGLDFVVVLSMANGIAAVVPSDLEIVANGAAARLGIVARSAGIQNRVHPFGLSRDASTPPVIVRERFAALDILRTMERRPTPLAAGDVERLTQALNTLPKARPVKPPSPNLLRVAEAAVRKVLGGDEGGSSDGVVAWAFGVDVTPKYIVDPTYLLPAVLVAAAKHWSAPVVAGGKEGGFLIRLSPDPMSLLGYVVSGIEVSNPVLFFAPIVDIVRRSFKNGECWLDGMVEEFAEYLKEQGHGGAAMKDIDVRMATSA